MLEQATTRIDSTQPLEYQILLQGHLGPRWAGWFDGMTISLEKNGHTLISGKVADQAALHGLLRKVRDLGMVLLSVQCLKLEII